MSYFLNDYIRLLNITTYFLLFSCQNEYFPLFTLSCLKEQFTPYFNSNCFKETYNLKSNQLNLNMQQPKILVAIRKRPLSKKQLSKGQTDIVTIKSSDTIIVSQYKQKVDLTKFLEQTIFNFDFAFHQETQNQQIYDSAVRPLVDSAFQGAKVTCFAYGQTGSGKTYTMNGNTSMGVQGLYSLGAQDIFSYLALPQFKHLKAKLSFYEIYCGKLFDLLNKRQQLKLRQDNKNNINIIGLEEAVITSSEEFAEYLNYGANQRVTSQNSANSQSSRSHAILQISLKDGKKLFGKISFIDLAGNERGADHMDMDKQTRIDGAQINKSLLSLKECIRALDQGKGHTPFRGSKLTMVLKDSFVGFCRTVMIGNVSPSSASSQNTLNTLRYADRVKQLRKPQEGVTKEDQKAKEMMLPRQNKNAIRIMINNDDDADDIAKKRQDAQKQYGIVGGQQKRQPQLQPQPQPQPVMKEDLNPRKNSFGGQKNSNAIFKMPQQQQTNKSNSLVKNPQQFGSGVGGNKPMMNNLMNNNVSNGGLQHKNSLGGNVNSINPMKKSAIESGANYDYRQNNQAEQVPTGMHRHNSGQTNFRQKEEPMEIETGPYYLPINNRIGVSIPSNANKIGGMGVNNMGGNNMGVNSNNMQISQQQSLKNYQQPTAMTNSVQLNNYNSTGTNMQNFNQNRSNYNSNQYEQNYGYNQAPSRQFSQIPNNDNIFSQKMAPHQQQYQYNQQYQQQQQQPIPQKWEDMVTVVSSSSNLELSERIMEEMGLRVIHEENQLMQHHSETLKKEVEMIRSEMAFLNEMELDKTRYSSRDYVRFMQDSIEEKLSNLQLLRERLIQFTYKLDDIEEMEHRGSKEAADDEQLLDDIN